MRKIFILFWLLVPVAVAAYHYGPGQEQVTIDEVATTLSEADDLATEGEQLVEADKQQDANKKFAAAIEKFDEAIQKLPSEKESEIQVIRLAKAKALFASQKNPDARKELESLLQDLTSEEKEEQDVLLIADTREALAASQFYMTWLMRIEGHPREVWGPEADRTRQNYKVLAESAIENNFPDRATKAKGDLEAAVRLALVDLEDLQGLPLPSQ